LLSVPEWKSHLVNKIFIGNPFLGQRNKIKRWLAQKETEP
jgi:hypothetical protein